MSKRIIRHALRDLKEIGEELVRRRYAVVTCIFILSLAFSVHIENTQDKAAKATEDIQTNTKFKSASQSEFVACITPILKTDEYTSPADINATSSSDIAEETEEEESVDTTPVTNDIELVQETDNTPTRENKLYYVNDSGYIYNLDSAYQDYLYQKLKEYEHPELYELCIALMYHESRFDINALSATNDHGLMQINGGNYNWLHKVLGITSLDDPYQNIDCGVYILTSALEKYKDAETALVCYNQGGKKITVGQHYSTKYSRCVLEDVHKLVETGE